MEDTQKTKRRRRPGGRKLAREHEERAQSIARRLTLLAEGFTGDPGTWQDVAKRLRVRYKYNSSIYGCYVRKGVEAGAATIAVNPRLTHEAETHVAVHELAHHLIYESQYCFIFETPLVHRYHDDEDGGPAHRIACRVERLVLG